MTGARIAFPRSGMTAAGRLTQTWRDRVPDAVWVAPDGTYSSQPRSGRGEDVVAGGAILALPELR